MKKFAFMHILICLLLCRDAVRAQTTLNFSYTGDMQTWTVPAGITSLSVTLRGAQGGNSTADFPFGGTGGGGGLVACTLAVTPGTTLYLVAGGVGGAVGNSDNGTGGYNGGAAAFSGAGGGGSTDIRIGGTDVTNRVVVAGGGGGGYHGGGGGGGDLTGGNGGYDASVYGDGHGGGNGGTQLAGGAGGASSNNAYYSGAGAVADGGHGGYQNGNTYYYGGGGGGGYYGGGGGFYGGGGGGSSYTDAVLASDITMTQGVTTGNGSISITYGGADTSGTTFYNPITTTGSASVCAGAGASTINIFGNAYDTVTYNENGGAAQTKVLDNSGTATFSINPAATDILTLTSVVHADGVTDTITGQADTITVTQLPVVTVTGDTVCDGTYPMITAIGPPNAQVYFDDMSSIILDGTGHGSTSLYPPPVGEHTYTAYSMTSNYCVGTANNATILVRPIPEAYIGGGGTFGDIICSGASAAITVYNGTPNATISFNNGVGPMLLDGSGYGTLSVTPAVSTDYTATVSKDGCSSSAGDETVTVKPTIMLAGDTTICADAHAVIHVSGAPNIDVNVTIAGDDITAQHITLDGTGHGDLDVHYPAGVYTEEVLYTEYCLSGAPVFVHVNALPAATITGSTTITNGAHATISVSGGTPNATVLLSNGGGTIALDSLGNGSISVSPANTTTYTATVSNGNCSAGAGSVTITVIAASAGTISGPNYVCVGGSISLTNSVGGGIWSSTDGDSLSHITQAGVLTGIAQGVDTILYTVGTAVARYKVTVYSNPIVNAGSDVAICAGTTATLTPSVTSATGPAYNWSPSVGLSCTTCASPVAHPTATTTYILKVTKNSCISRDTVVVTVNPLPTAGVIIGGSGLNIGTAVQFSSTVPGGVFSDVHPAFATVTPSGLVTGIADGVDTIKYSVTNSCGTATAKRAVTFLHTGTITGPKYVCAGSTINFADSAGTPGGTWSSVYPTATVDQSGVVTGVSAGLATIKYTISGVTIQKSISVFALPNVNTGSSYVYIAPGGSTTLTATGDATSYLWTPSTGLSCTRCASPTASPATTKTYVVTGTKTGCSATAQVTVHVGSPDRGTQPSGISEAATDIKVYPNPTRNELNIELNANNEDMHITLVDITGRTVAEIANTKQAMGNQHVTYNAGSLASGVYYVHIELGAQVMTQNVVITH